MSWELSFFICSRKLVSISKNRIEGAEKDCEVYIRRANRRSSRDVDQPERPRIRRKKPVIGSRSSLCDGMISLERSTAALGAVAEMGKHTGGPQKVFRGRLRPRPRYGELWNPIRAEVGQLERV